MPIPPIISPIGALVSDFAISPNLLILVGNCVVFEAVVTKIDIFVLSMLKSNGMGKTPAKYGDNISGNKSINTYKSINNQAEVLLINSLELAIRTLEQEERLLLKIAEFLSNNRSLNQKQLTNFIRKYATNKNILSLIKQNNSFYRNQLLQKVHLLDSTSKISKKNINSFDFSLNNKLSTEC